MISLALALSLFAQAPAETAATPAPAEAEAAAMDEPRMPTGAPKEDYPFVAWCYGALRGYLDLHDEMMPEVTRIESAFRRPGAKLEDDLKVYADMQKDGKAKLKQFQAAMTAAEKASVRPINMIGAQAVRKGRDTWASNDTSKARLAEAWMGWALPARCEKVATSLEAKSKLMGVGLKANVKDAPPADPAPTPDAPASADPTTNPTAEAAPPPAR